MILLDIQPWSVVNDPGFLRHHALIAPNYEIGSEKYYRSMLNPTYEKVKDAMKNLLKENMPTQFQSLLMLGHHFTTDI
jgi:hypothetical protein